MNNFLNPMKKIERLLILIVVVMGAAFAPLFSFGDAPNHGTTSARNYLVYIGTYTTEQSKGIYAYRFNVVTGQFVPLGLAAETSNPSFLAVHPNHKILYAVNEIGNFQNQSSGAVSAFAIDSHTGKLTLLNQVASRGADPCYVAVDKTGKHVLVANYGGGNVAVFPVLKGGKLRESTRVLQYKGTGANPERQESPHAHWIDFSPDNRFVVAADLGLDQLDVYKFSASKGSLVPNQPAVVQLKPGAGVRHFAFHPNARFGYAVNEMQSSVVSFAYDPARGTLHELQTISILPKDFTGKNDAAEIQIHPSGKFLYASNRGHDSIAVFSIDPTKGTLTPVEYVPTQGKAPRYFAVDPTGSRLFVANQNSGTIVVFQIDPTSGRLTSTGQVLQIASPVCLRLVPVR
jgi:6-phosphogluconolactonase